MVKEAWELTLDWIQLFNSGKNKLAVTCKQPSSCRLLARKREITCTCCFTPTGSTLEEGDVEVYRTVRHVDYPRDPSNDKITAAIHPQLQVQRRQPEDQRPSKSYVYSNATGFSSNGQDQDFKLLRKGDPVFLTFSGETLRHEGDELHPFFINECAYYEKRIAFHLGRKVKVSLPPLRVQQT